MDTAIGRRRAGAARAASLAIKTLIALLVLWAQNLGFARAGHVAVGHFLYFTNISNILCGLCALAFIAYELRRARPPVWLLRARLAAAAGIVLVFIVFSLLLSPLMDDGYLRSRDNALAHNLVPLLFALDFIVFGYGRERAPGSPLPGLVTPLLYFVLVFALSRRGAFFGGGARFPYFFLDDAATGWFTLGGGRLGVAWWLLLMSAALWGISAGLLYLQRGIGAAVPAGEGK